MDYKISRTIIACAVSLFLLSCSNQHEEARDEGNLSNASTRILNEVDTPSSEHCIWHEDMEINTLRTSEDLWEIERHYLYCEDNIELAENALVILSDRNDLEAKIELAVIYMNTGRKRERMIELLEEASEAGSDRARAILARDVEGDR